MPFALWSRLEREPAPRTERLCDQQVGTEPKGHGAEECIGRRLHEDRVDEGRAGRVADQDGDLVVGIVELLLDELAQLLEVAGGKGTRFAARLELLEVVRDVDPDHQGVEGGELAGHVDHALIPTAIPGHEENDLGRLRARVVERHRPEASERDGLLGRVGKGREKDGCGGDAQRENDDHAPEKEARAGSHREWNLLRPMLAHLTRGRLGRVLSGESKEVPMADEKPKYYDPRSDFWRMQFAAAKGYREYLASGDPAKAERWPAMESKLPPLTDEQAERLRGLNRKMNVLFYSGVWCGDCVRQGPMVRRIAEASGPGVVLRFIDRDTSPELRDELRILGAMRVPVAVFLSEDFFEIGRFGDRMLTVYRAKARREVGAACSAGILAPPVNELASEMGDWIDIFERMLLMLRLSPMLRERYGD